MSHYVFRHRRGAAGKSQHLRIFGVNGYAGNTSEPRATYYNGKTYLTWTRMVGSNPSTSADIYVAEYVHATRTLSTPVLLSSSVGAVDGPNHVVPAIIVRSSDRKLVVAAVANGGTVQPKVWISTNAEDATAFGAGTSIGSSAVYTYTSLVEVSSGIYLFVHWWTSGVRHLAYYKSTDNGSTWGSLVDIVKPTSTTTLFARLLGDGTRIDIFTTNTDRLVTPASVYHMYLSGTTLYKSDGTSIGAAASGPYFAGAGTLVHDATLGSAWCNGAAYTAGKPAALICVNDGDTTTDMLIRHAQWTGSAWSVNAITNTGGVVPSSYGGYLQVAGTMHRADPFTIWVPKFVGSHFEMYRYTSADSGSNWTGTQMTSGSPVDQLLPETVLDAGTGLDVVWHAGTFADHFGFYFDVRGWG